MKFHSVKRRSALATVEATWALGVSIPLAAAMLTFGIRASRAFYHLVASLTCWPYM